MALVRVTERGEITLPRELQEAEVREGATLEAEAVEGGIPLKPVSGRRRQLCKAKRQRQGGRDAGNPAARRPLLLLHRQKETRCAIPG